IALLLYPGFLTLGAFGLSVEVLWASLARRSPGLPDVRRSRPPVVQVAVGLLAMFAAVQFSPPFNPVPIEDRNVVIAAIAIGFTAWAELALDPELVAEPGLLV